MREGDDTLKESLEILETLSQVAEKESAALAAACRSAGQCKQECRLLPTPPCEASWWVPCLLHAPSAAALHVCDCLQHGL
jgi:hypothetical protein